jgi:hypothetical protein
MKRQSAIAPINRQIRQVVTFYSVADLAETLKAAEQFHKANHLPSGTWPEEYASYIFNHQGASITPVVSPIGANVRPDDSDFHVCHTEGADTVLDCIQREKDSRRNSDPTGIW